jgi:hypothetical protein
MRAGPSRQASAVSANPQARSGAVIEAAGRRIAAAAARPVGAENRVDAADRKP